MFIDYWWINIYLYTSDQLLKLELHIIICTITVQYMVEINFHYNILWIKFLFFLKWQRYKLFLSGKIFAIMCHYISWQRF